jgi:VWFA-related protein
MKHVKGSLRVPTILASLAVLSLTAGGGAQQEGQAGPPYVLRQNVRLVIVPVTVKDRDGRPVEDLTAKDFRVFEDGQERPIRYFSNESTPLSAVILIDTGMSDHSLSLVRQTASSLSAAFGPQDRTALYVFDNTIRLLQDFTSDPSLLARALAKEQPQGSGPLMIGGPVGGPAIQNGVSLQRPGTLPGPPPAPGKRLRDALYSATQRLKNEPRERRRMVLVVSDGVNGSDNDLSYRQVLAALQRSDVSVFAVSFGLGTGRILRRADLLARVAHDSGGDIAYVQRRPSLEAAYARLADESRNAYVLGFAPASADGELHEIRVRVDRHGARLIARNRFFAPPER